MWCGFWFLFRYTVDRRPSTDLPSPPHAEKNFTKRARTAWLWKRFFLRSSSDSSSLQAPNGRRAAAEAETTTTTATTVTTSADDDDDDGDNDQDVDRDDDGGMSFEAVDPAGVERSTGNFR